MLRPQQYQAKRRGGGFTLVEMLVVIAIVLILAALLLTAAFDAIRIAREAAIRIELGQLDAAVHRYRVDHGSFPPNCNPAAIAVEPIVKAHIQSSFGHSNPSPPFGMDAGETLVFWLQGYSNNRLDPLSGSRVALFDFNPTRIVNGMPLYHYYPAHGQGQPYIYIHNASYGTLTYAAASPGSGTARAYNSSVDPNTFVNAKSFQIISAGLDGDYGFDHVNKQFPAGLNYRPGDRDNLTNFSEGTLGSKVQ